jgi:UDP-glucose 4-epimerase
VQQLSVRNDVSSDVMRGADVVIHVAGLTPRKGVTDVDFYEVNTERTRQLFKVCEEAGVGHFIYISTMAVYGSTLKKIGANQIIKTSVCVNPTAYGNSKLMAEKAIIENSKSVKWTILRIPSLYDQNKLDYFDIYKTVAERLPILPKMTYCTKRSLLCFDNLCELLLQIVKNKEQFFYNKIILPSDALMPDVNDLFAKICKEKGLTRIYFPMGIRLSKLCCKFVPQLLSLFMNAYYGDSDCYKIPMHSVNNVTLSTAQEKHQ